MGATLGLGAGAAARGADSVASSMKSPTHCNQIGGISTPASMIIQPQLTTHFRRPPRKRNERSSGLRDISLLGLPARIEKGLPDLRLDTVLSEQAKGAFMLTPERKVLNSMFTILQDFFLKLSYMPYPPVVGTSTKTKLGKHY